MTKDEALRLAFEALTKVDALCPVGSNEEIYVREAIYAIKAALEAKDEPMAWMHVQGNHEEPSLRQLDDWEIQNGWKQYPLYTTPPQRKPLTDDQITLIIADCASSHQHLDIHLARAIEAAHGIKGEA